MNNEQQSLDVLDIITIISLVLQIQSLQELHSQASSDDIFRELQKQDRKYLDTIEHKLDMILDKLTSPQE